MPASVLVRNIVTQLWAAWSLSCAHDLLNFAGDEGYEGDEGDEGDEGNEGDEGLKGDDAYSVTTGTTLNFATCKSSATAATVSQMKDVHLDLAAHAIHAFCDEHWDGSIMEV